MKYGTFLGEVDSSRTIQIPRQVWEKLRIEPGDHIEISIKRIKSGKLDLLLSENPLYRLLNFKDVGASNEKNDQQP